jgi:hypothetical protein
MPSSLMPRSSATRKPGVLTVLRKRLSQNIAQANPASYETFCFAAFLGGAQIAATFGKKAC